MELNVEVEKKRGKQIIIIAIYVTFFLLIVSAIFYALKPKPNCFDGKLNQDEEKVDCGGICARKCEVTPREVISVEKTGYVASGLVNKYDIYGEIYNPNAFMGSKEFSYEFKIKNSQGVVIGERKGINFILPGERKYIIESNVETNEVPVSVELVVSAVKWIEFSVDDYQKPELKVVNKVYSPITSGVGFSEVKGLIKNESQFDFATIKVYIIVRNKAREILALNSTQMNTVKAGENRDFRVYWPSRFPGEVEFFDVQTDVNVFDSESFVKRYFNTGKFQEY